MFFNIYLIIKLSTGTPTALMDDANNTDPDIVSNMGEL